MIIAKGKFHDWLTDDGLLLIEGWARAGLNDEQIASNMGISTATYYDWQKKFPSISEAIKKGKAPVDLQVENALLKRALGYYWEEITTEIYKDGTKHIKKVTRHVPSDPASMFFWLKNRKPQQWRERQVIETPADDRLLEYLEAFKNADKK